MQTSAKKFALNCFLLILLVFGCRQRNEPDVVVGLYGPLTGNTASFGQQILKGAEFGVSDANSAGGVNGRKLRLIVEDDRGNPQEAQAAVTRLITRSHAVAIIGEASSSGSLAGAPVCQQYRIPMITPTATNPKVTEAGDFIFRVCWIDPFQGQLMAKFAMEKLRARRFAVLFDVTSDYSTGLTEVFSNTVIKRGGSIVQKSSYSGGDTDFSAQLTAILSSKPDALYVPGYYNEAGLIARQARVLGVDIPIIGCDGWDSPQLWQIGGKALNNSFYCVHFIPADPSQAVQRFVRAFKLRYGQEPPGGSALAYDAVQIVTRALRKVGNFDPVRVRDVLATTKDYQGLTGSITIDSNRNAVKPAVVLRCQDGKPEFVERINP